VETTKTVQNRTAPCITEWPDPEKVPSFFGVIRKIEGRGTRDGDTRRFPFLWALCNRDLLKGNLRPSQRNKAMAKALADPPISMN
jgi:hypothetical protein